MPIRGITDSVQAAFPRLGKLRKGSEAQRTPDGKVIKMGQDLAFFRFTSERPEVVSAFEVAYGQQPTLITAFLPYATAEENFQCWKESWVAGGLKHRCDGETMVLWLDKDGTYRHDPQPCNGGCDEVGRLSLIIPEIITAGFVGFVTLETHGINDLVSIQASLLAASEARAGNPAGLKGIQWTLQRVKEKISTPLGNGKRGRRDKWLVKLQPAADWVRLQMEVAHNATMMLPAPKAADEQGVVIDGAGRPVDRESGEILEQRATGDDVRATEVEPVEPDATWETTDDYDDNAAQCQDVREQIEATLARIGHPMPSFVKWYEQKYAMGYNVDDLEALNGALAKVRETEAKKAKAS